MMMTRWLASIVLAAASILPSQAVAQASFTFTGLSGYNWYPFTPAIAGDSGVVGGSYLVGTDGPGYFGYWSEGGGLTPVFFSYDPTPMERWFVDGVGISADASTIVGRVSAYDINCPCDPNEHRAFVWTSGSGMTWLGAFPGAASE